MTIQNFDILLNDVLTGKTSAVLQWGDIQQSNGFSQEELGQAKAQIEMILSLEDSSSVRKSYALNLRGFMLSEGPDLQATIRDYEQAIELDNPMAMINLAHFLEVGIEGILEVNQVRAIELYSRAAQLNQPIAMTILGEHYLNGVDDIIPIDIVKGLELLNQALALNFTWAMERLGRVYLYGIPNHIEPNIPQAMTLLRRAAQEGDTEAMFQLAQILLNGIEEQVDASIPEALQFYEQAANYNHAPSLNELGYHYLYGISDHLSINIPLAMEFYERAANLDYTDAQVSLAELYEEQQRYDLAVEYYSRASNLGHPRAKARMAHFYLWGLAGVIEIDREKGAQLIREAAELKDLGAMFIVAETFSHNGRGLRDLPMTRELYQEILQHNDLSEEERTMVVLKLERVEILARMFFDNKLQTLASKELEMRKKGEIDPNYQVAADSVSELYWKLIKVANQFLSLDDSMASLVDSKMQFKTECLQAIADARPVLETHRGWKEFFVQITNALLSFCSWGIANLVTGRWGVFSASTDSAQKLNDIEQSIVDNSEFSAGI